MAYADEEAHKRILAALDQFNDGALASEIAYVMREPVRRVGRFLASLHKLGLVEKQRDRRLASMVWRRKQEDR